MQVLIINTGGTFNKIYNPKEGSLEIKANDTLLRTIFKKYMVNYKDSVSIKGILYKDSLEFTSKDRKALYDMIIKYHEYDKVIIIHGTDTMDLTATYLAKKVQNKQIILTGAMVPFSIDQVEAMGNLAMSFGFIQNLEKNGIYICMQGIVKEHHKIRKNKTKGVFEVVK